MNTLTKIDFEEPLSKFIKTNYKLFSQKDSKQIIHAYKNKLISEINQQIASCNQDLLLTRTDLRFDDDIEDKKLRLIWLNGQKALIRYLIR